MWSASLLFVGGIAYAITVAIGMVSVGLERPIGDPVLAVMEILTLLLAPLIVVMMAAVHTWAPFESKTHTLVAFAFAVLLTGVTTAVHFVQLTALRQLGSAGLVWPSPTYAAELLAWDVLLGLSLLFAAFAFRGDKLQKTVRRTMLVCGSLCIMGALGPGSGNMRLQFIAVVGYGLIFPVICLLLALLFQRSPGPS